MTETPYRTTLGVVATGNGFYVAIDKQEIWNPGDDAVVTSMHNRVENLPGLDIWWFMMNLIRNPRVKPQVMFDYLSSWVPSYKLENLYDNKNSDKIIRDG